MELPFIVVFEPPSRTELRALLRMRGTWVVGLLVGLAIGLLVVVTTASRADAVTDGRAVPLELSSHPSGAGVWLDGRERGATPLRTLVEPGIHRVVLKTADALDGQYAVSVGPEGTALDAVLWRRQPSLTRLRPALPGAELSDVRLLSDGQLALSLALPPGRSLQAWRLDPQSGAVEPILTDAVGSRLAVASDGQRVAYLGSEIGPAVTGASPAGADSGRASVVWLVAGGALAPASGWRPPLGPGERLVDASWSPGGDRLLAVSTAVLNGGASRSRLWLLAASGERADEALALPSDVVPGSVEWSPDGQHLAFLAHTAAVNALCLLNLDGTFRYVADLDASPTPPAYPPAAWSADSQRLLFVAPHQHPPGTALGWLQPETRHALFVADVAEPTPVLIGDTDVDLAAWREDGQLLGLARSGPEGGLALSLMAGSASGQHLLDVPVRPAAAYATAWDLAHARLVIASPGTSGSVEYWLASLGLESQP